MTLREWDEKQREDAEEATTCLLALLALCVFALWWGLS